MEDDKTIPVAVAPLSSLEGGEDDNDIVEVAGSPQFTAEEFIEDDNTGTVAGSALHLSELDDHGSDTLAAQAQFTQTDPLYRHPHQLPIDESNFLRFCHLIQKLAPEAVRHRFDQEFPPNDLACIIHRNKTKLKDLNFRRFITNQQLNLIFPHGSVPVSSSFDVTLMLCLFRHLTNISPISGDYDSCPPLSDVTLGGDLARIKYYRNKIAHYSEKDRKMDNQDFSIVWETVSKAVGRIGGPSYEQQCTTLLTTSLDSSYLDIYREFVELLSKQREHMEILESRQVELEKKLNDPVSPIETGTLTDIQITEWQKMDKKFIVTRASEHVLWCLKTKKCVTVTGSSGVGKTATIRHVALQMKKEGYTILPIKHPWDVVKSYDHNKKILFVIDDCCGKYHISQIDLENWKKEMEDIERLLEKSCTKIIIGCRLQVYVDLKFEALSLFKSCACNMMSEKFCLSVTERTAIAKLYLKKNAPKITIDDKFDFFPLLCSLCENRTDLANQDFFENPFMVYENELNAMSSNGAKVKLCVLGLIVMFNNKLHEYFLIEDIEVGMQSVIEKTCEACKVNKGTSRLVLRDELESLINTYLSKHDNMYSTIHDKLFDLLAYYFGKSITSCLIKNADSCFIRERFLYFELETNDQFTIIIPEKYQQMYFDRLLKDLLEGEVKNVFSNINMKIDRFRKIFYLRMQKLDLAQQNFIAKMTDKRTEETVLIRNCLHGYEDFIYWCLSLHVDINVTTPDKRSPLFMACFMGHTHIVKILLKHNVNRCLINDASPFNMACQNAHTEMGNMLLHHNAHVNKCNSYDETPLFAACAEDHTDIVNVLLSHNGDVNKCDDIGTSPLYLSCQNGNTEIVNMLLNHNADVNKCNDVGTSPLYISCQNGNTEIVNMLLNHNADVNKCDDDSASPLYISCQNGHTEIVNMLLNHNADVNKCGNDSASPLYISCQNGHTEIVNMLLNHNADVNKCDDDSASPLYISCQNGHTEIVNMLLNHNADVNKCDDDSASPLYISCHNGQTEIVNMLLNYNADVNKCNDYGTSPLCITCQNGHTEIVNMLLNHNADVNKCDNKGVSPLFESCQHGYQEIVSKLIRKNADINKCWDIGESPLFVACQCGHTEIVSTLLNSNAEINKCMKNGTSPIFIACQNGHKKIVKMLLNHNADINKCRNNGTSPLYIACERGNTEIVCMLIAKNADIEFCENHKQSPLFIACQNGHTELVRKLLDKNADTNTCNNEGISPLGVAFQNDHMDVVKMLPNYDAGFNTSVVSVGAPLFIACQRGRAGSVSKLLQTNADINTCLDDGTSSLLIACQNGHGNVVDILLNHNADINKCRKNGVSPLYISCEKGHTEIVRKLIDKNADIDISENSNQTPLFIACQNGYTEIVKMLLDNHADVNKRNNDGLLPVNVAGNIEIWNMFNKNS